VPTLFAVAFPTLGKLYPNLVTDNTKEGTRDAANQWWRDQLEKLADRPDEREHAHYWHNALAQHRARKRWHEQQDDTDGVAQEQAEIERIETVLKGETLPEPLESWVTTPNMPFGYFSSVKPVDPVWADRLSRSTKPKPSRSISKIMESFLAAVKAEVVTGTVTYDRVHNMRYELLRFVQWFGEEDVRTVKGLTLTNFRTHLFDQIEKGELADTTARDTMVTTRRFVRWCGTNDILGTLPRNIDGKELKISVKPKAIKLWDDAAVKFLMQKSDERQKLFCLLMLNTGMTSYEIALMSNQDKSAEAQPDYFHTPRLDWKRGRVTRKRSKTKGYTNVPTVECKLWAETMRLLKKFGSRTSNPVLTNEDDGPLVSKSKKDSAKPVRNDCIGLNFRRFRAKMNGKKSQLPNRLKDLRKTGGTKLGTSNEFARFAEFWLGHSPKGTAETFYIKPDQQQFDAAVNWLESQAKNLWGIETLV
jgi:hypothetical protein